MLKQLIKDSVIYGIGRVAIVALGFLVLPFLTNNLSTSEYGVVDLFVLCVTLLNITVALEISQAVSRFLGEKKDKQMQVLYSSTALFFSVFMYTLASMLIYIFHGKIAELLFHSDENAHLVLFVIPWFMLHGLNYFITNQLRWENRSRVYIIIKTVNAALFLLAIILLIQQQKMGVEGVLYSYIISLGVTAIIGFWLLIKSGSVKFIFCTEQLRQMLKFSSPLVFSSAAVFAQNYIDRFMINGVLGLESVGLYGFAFKVASSLTLISMSFQLSLTPLIYQSHKEEGAPLQIARSLNLYLFLMFAATIGLCMFLPEMFYLFIGTSFYASAYIIPLLCFSVILASLCIFTPGVFVTNKTGWFAFVNIIGMVINILLNLIFIKYFGINGAAFASVMSLIIVTFIGFYISHKHYPIPYAYGRIGAATAITVTSLLWIRFSNEVSINSFHLQEFFIKIIIFIIIAAVLLAVFYKEKLPALFADKH
jgi:O-antigen/teichoic acid export membrane protein